MSKVVRKSDGSRTVIGTGANASGIVTNLPSEKVLKGPARNVSAPSLPGAPASAADSPTWLPAARTVACAQAVQEAQNALATAQSALTAAQDQAAALRAEISPSMTAYQARSLELNQKRTAARTAVEGNLSALVDNARRLYVEAGINPRLAGMLASDMRDSVTGTSRWTPSDAYGSLSPVRFKVKRKGDDDLVAKTEAAAAASKTDAAYQHVAGTINAGVATLNALSGEQANTREQQKEYEENQRRWHAACRVVDAATEKVTRATQALQETQRRNEALVPPTAVRSTLDGSRLHNAPEISRNPDGSTNVWVLQGPDETHPTSWYDPVVGVGVSENDSYNKSNFLVTASGSRVQRVEHWFRGPGTGWNREPVVVIAEPAPGASPLANEGHAGNGWSILIDTTD